MLRGLKIMLIGIALGWCARSYIQLHNYRAMDANRAVWERRNVTFTDVCFVGLH